ncbi:DUF4145 domain-containing protein [Halanaerobium sp. MA284_MarDTE_T2]|uniref:DUF4145 domain-containing protein n=1 Tax=Halanaerobium sp. MA284_MarDTE_T2 TaxID=2183913 RepID=UPI000DF46280|nr:DUF4145 domain-containing protein [Halanaerobium sp. MA284_MarDTE_T2]RCW49757.1 uncharacterized protein DUF4145 [Halanaerobium sp. MA284_MarDTE_T2]
MGVNKAKRKILECYHFGNETLMKQFGDHSKVVTDRGFNEDMGLFVTREEEFKWEMYYCPVCEKITLFYTYSNSYADYPSENILYPRFDYEKKEVLDKINNSFVSALKTKHFDLSICLLSLRRTLEMICKDKGFNDGSLAAKISNMVKEGVLPSLLNSASSIVRDLGNQVAHADDFDHTHEEVDNSIEFVEQIINYIYVLPAKIKNLQSENDFEEQ